MLASEWEGIEKYLLHLKGTLLHEVFQVDWEEFQELVKQSTLDARVVQAYNIDSLCLWGCSGLFGATAGFMSRYMRGPRMSRWNTDPVDMGAWKKVEEIRARFPPDIRLLLRHNPLKDRP